MCEDRRVQELKELRRTRLICEISQCIVMGGGGTRLTESYPSWFRTPSILKIITAPHEINLVKRKKSVVNSICDLLSESEDIKQE